MTAFEEIEGDLHLSPRERVVDAVREWVRSGDVRGKSLPSERTLAETLDVSRVTVRAALKQLMAEGVVLPSSQGTRRQTVGADRPRSQSLLHHTIAVLSESRPVDESLALLTGWDTFTVRHASKTFEQHGYHVLNLNVKRLADEGLEDLLANRPAGLLAAHDACESPLGQEVLASCADRGIPIIASRDLPALAAYDVIEADHEQGSYELTRWLIAHGRRRILRFWRFPQEHEWLRRRNLGYERAIREAGLDPLPIVRTTHLSTLTADREEFSHMARTVAGYLIEYLSGPGRVDAVMTATDPHAFQVAAACRLFGAKPNEDVWIAGFDNTWQQELSREFEPVGPMITADKQNAVIGESLASLLLDRISGRVPAIPQKRLIEPQLIVVSEFEKATLHGSSLTGNSPQRR
jgi:DNA-binding LacI/PurR family transcriptional regulator